MFSARGPEGTRLEQGWHVSYAEAGVVITVGVPNHAPNARDLENRQTDFPAPAAEAKGSMECNSSAMTDVGNTIRKSLQKRQAALTAFEARKKAFLLSKEQIKKDIEEARTIWNHTLEQLPAQEFKW